jgi:hypothetical protein
MNFEERGTYYYSWIIIMLAKESEKIQWMVAAKRRYMVMVFQVESQRYVDRCILVSIRTLS